MGKPDDVPGECNAHCYIGDDYGDNTATMRCPLPKGHEGAHRKRFRDDAVLVEWTRDERCLHVKTEQDEVYPDRSFCTECGETVWKEKTE